MDILNSLASFLEASGGWGVAVIAIVALWKKDQQFGKKMDERHDEMLVLIKETSLLLGSVREVLQRCNRLNGGGGGNNNDGDNNV